MIYFESLTQTLSVTLAKDERIIYYQGTYDPPHKGHVLALQGALSASGATKAFVVADEEDNLYKPNRTPYVHREAMFQLAFQDIPNIYVSNLPKAELRRRMCEIAYVIILIGTDIWPILSKKATIPFRGICVSLRGILDEAKSIPFQLNDKEVIVFSPEITGYSSTSIRQHFRSSPGYYNRRVSPQLDRFPCDIINPRVLDYILHNQIYYDSQQAFHEKVIQQTEEFVRSALPGKSIEITCITRQGQGGESGDLTFKAHTSDGAGYFVKAYIQKEHLENFRCEKKGIHLLNRLSLRWSRAVETLFLEKQEADFSLMGVSLIPGKDVARTFKELAASQKTAEFLQMCFCVGRALSELHRCKTTAINTDRIAQETSKLNHRAKDCLERSSLIPQEKQEILSRFIRSYTQFSTHPGTHSYTHGDANLANFIVDVTSGRVTMVDLERLGKFQTMSEEPLGFPAEDYHRFAAGIKWLSQSSPSIPPDVVTLAQKEFNRGYQVFTSTIKPEADQYFQCYWEIRNLSCTK